MELNYFKYYKPGAIIPFILISGTLISILISSLISLITKITNLEYYQFPSTTVLIGVLIYFIDQSLWKYKPFKWLYWTKDISGRYEGVIRFNHYMNNSREYRDFALEIEQTGSMVKLKTYFNDNRENTSKSESKNVNLIKDGFGNISIFMNYYNSGNSILGIPEHYGTNVLEYCDGNFTGNYYTSKEPQTKGLMEAKYIGKKFKKTF